MDIPQAIPYNAEGAITAYSIVKAGASGGVLQASAVADLILGVTTEIPAATGENCDVQIDGVVPLKSGGVIALGARLTTDASGNAVTAAPAAGTNNSLVGIALEAAAAGDVFRVKIQLGTVQG